MQTTLRLLSAYRTKVSNMTRSFKFLSANVDEQSEWFIASQHSMQQATDNLLKLKAEFLEGGGVKSRTAHVVRNKKLLPRDRLSAVLDSQDNFELGTLLGFGQPYGNIPQGGTITVIGKVSGRLCVLMVNDATIKGGTIYPITLKKQLRAEEIAMQNGLPLIILVDSGGAFLPLQSDIFPDSQHGGRIFYNEAILSSMRIPVLSLVCGSCTAGGAYVPCMSEEMGMVSGVGYMFLGGPPLVRAATGEVVSAEDLGGAWMHSSVSGCSDHYFPDESTGLETLRDIVATLPAQQLMHDNVNLIHPCSPLYPQHQLMGLQMNADIPGSTVDEVRLKRERMEQIIARLFDASEFFEFKRQFGTHLMTGFARLNGRLVGVVASFGALTGSDGIKGSHFVQLCDQRVVPILFLVHCPASADGDPDPLRGMDKKNKLHTPIAIATELKEKSEFLSTVATSSSVKLTLVVGDAMSWDYQLMAGRSMSPHFVFAWPTARFGLPGDAEEEKGQLAPASALLAAGHLWIDEVIRPQDTRQVLSNALEVTATRSVVSSLPVARKPVLRF